MKQKPTIVILITLAAFLIANSISLDFLLSTFELGNSSQELLEELIINSLLALFAVYIIKSSKLNDLAGIGSSRAKNSWLIVVPIYLILLGVSQLIKNEEILSLPFGAILLLLVSSMSIGFSEEFIFRGIFQTAMLKKLQGRKSGILISVLVPAFIFGALHLLNFRSENAASEISQFLYAIYFGVFFGAVLLRTKKLIPIAIVHGLIDFVFGFDQLLEPHEINESASILNAIASSIVVLPLFIIGLVILGRLGKPDLSEEAI